MEISISELVEAIAGLIGFDGRIEWDTSKLDGQPRSCFDTTRARERFGWEATMEFEARLERTIEWYKQHRREIVDR
jgi:nucleoside-diphosphate-sugar epimerase